MEEGEGGASLESRYETLMKIFPRGEGNKIIGREGNKLIERIYRCANFS